MGDGVLVYFGCPQAHEDDAERAVRAGLEFGLSPDDLGSTALSARMDPEDLREVISAYQKCVAETVQRFGSSQSTWATACSCTSAVPRRTRTTRSGLCERDWSWSLLQRL